MAIWLYMGVFIGVIAGGYFGYVLFKRRERKINKGYTGKNDLSKPREQEQILEKPIIDFPN